MKVVVVGGGGQDRQFRTVVPLATVHLYMCPMPAINIPESYRVAGPRS